MKTKLITDHPDYWLLVYTDTKPAKGEKFIIMYEDESYLNIEESPLDNFSDYADSDFTDECFKIIGHLPKVKAPLLERVPLLVPLPEQGEDVNQLAAKEFPYPHDIIKLPEAVQRSIRINHGIRRGDFKSGYKVASKGGLYTEEQFHHALTTAITILYKDHPEFEEEHTTGWDMMQILIQSLPVNKEPVNFIPTIIPINEGGYEVIEIIQTLPNETGKEVIQGRWIYK